MRKAGFWVFGMRATDKIVRLVRITVLAGLLLPEDFGLFGIAMLALSLVESVSRTGFTEALIQKEGEIGEDLDTAFTVQALRGVGIAALLYLAAGPVALFFESPEARPLLQALSAYALLTGLISTGVVRFARDLAFHRQFGYQFAGTLADLVVSIAAALLLRDAWALVLGLLAGSAVQTVASHLVAGGVRFRFDRERARALVRYGRWIWGANIAQYVLNEGDDVFVGKFLGTEALGTYRLAYLYGNLPTTEITHVISAVTFPAYSRMQGDLPRLREAFLRALRVTVFLSAPVSAGIILLTPDFVHLFLRPEWESVILPMQILTFWGFLRSIGSTVGAVLQGLGRPDLITRLVAVRIVILAASIYPLTVRFGLPGTAAAVVLSALLVHPLTYAVAMRTTGTRASSFVSALLWPVGASLVMAGAVLLLREVFSGGVGVPAFCALALAGTVVYAVAVLLMRKLFGYDILADLP